MSVPAHALRDSLSTVMEARSLNYAQHRRLFNPDREVNSLAERIAALRRHGVPEAVVKALFADVRAVLLTNAAEGGCLHELAGTFDDLARMAHHAECNSTVSRALDIQSLAKALRPHLRTIAKSPDTAAAVQARREVERLAAQLPVSTLTGKSLRHELRATAHDLLLNVIGTGVGA